MLTLGFSATAMRAQEPASRAVERSLPSLPKSCYFVVPRKQAPVAGKKGGLVVVLPGGDGSREFLPFVENGLLAQVPDDCTGVLVTAVVWTEGQKIIWPTEQSRVEGMQYTTGDYVRAVVAAVGADHPFDPARAVVVAWSSSGPAVYPLLAAKDGPFARGYVAMSVWPKGLDLAAVKGRRFVLDQSPEDQTTSFSHVREAFAVLTKAGAAVRLSTYEGGHGWHDNPLPRFRKGLTWLLSDAPAPKPEWPEAKKASAKGKVENLLQNGGFEKGLTGWQVVNNSKNLKAEPTKDDKREGKQALHLQKQGGGALDLVTQSVELPEGAMVQVRMQAKANGAKNAWLKVFVYGKDDKPLHEDVNLVHFTGDAEWKPIEKSWSAEGAVRAVVQMILVGDGELWVDDVVLAVTK